VAYQVRTSHDVPLLRVWAVSAVTPLARLLGSASGGTSNWLQNYLLLAGARQENERLRSELDRLRMENRYLRSELGTADRAQALSAFQAHTPSRTIAARVIGVGPSVDSRVLLIDRGADSGVRAGMAVINPDGIVGKVTAAYPATSHVVLVTDASFAAGVVSAKNKVQGTLRGSSSAVCRVDHLQNEETVEVGEWFYTSGDDRLFPRGLPAGQVKSVAAGRTFKEVIIEPSGLRRGLEEVLVVLEGVHQQVPVPEAPAEAVSLLPPPSEGSSEPQTSTPAPSAPVLETDADRLVNTYRKSAEASGRPFGDNVQAAKPAVAAPGTSPPSAAAGIAKKPPAAKSAGSPGAVRP